MDKKETLHRIAKFTLCVAIICGIVAGWTQLPELENKAEDFTEWVGLHPKTGMLVIGGIFMIAEILFVPRIL